MAAAFTSQQPRHNYWRYCTLCVLTFAAAFLGFSLPTVGAQGLSSVFQFPWLIKPESQTTAGSESSRWIRQSVPAKRVAVVFVHGYSGHVVDTWTNSDTDKTFFDYLLESEIRDDVDLFAFGYPSGLDGKNFNINEAATLLKFQLETKGVMDYEHIVVAAHSMGGLVAMRALISNEGFRDKVSWLVLYATPQEGSHLAYLAQRVYKSAQLADLTPAELNTFLQSMLQDWNNLNWRPKVSCGYEVKETYGVIPVGWASGSRICIDEDPIPIAGANHIDIVKPDDKEHDSVSLLTRSVQRVIAHPGAAVGLPDIERQGQEYVLIMQDAIQAVRVVNQGWRPIRIDFKKQDKGDSVQVGYLRDRQILPNNDARVQFILVEGRNTPFATFDMLVNERLEAQISIMVDREAVKERRNARLETVLSQMQAHVAQPAVHDRLSQLRPDSDEGRHELALIAYKAALEEYGSDSGQAAWLLAADTLSMAGLTDAASIARQQLDTAPPRFIPITTWPWAEGTLEAAGVHFAEAPAVLNSSYINVSSPFLGTVIHGEPPFVPVLPDTSGTRNEAPIWTPEITALRTKLAKQFKDIPALRADGLTLEGDDLFISGKKSDALAAYRAAAAYQPLSAAQARIRVLEAHPPSSNPNGSRYGPEYDGIGSIETGPSE